MKSILKFAILVIAAFFAFIAKGQQNLYDPDGLPEELPVWTKLRMLDWCVTNRTFTIPYDIVYTNKSGVLTNWGNLPVTDGSRFDSYSSFWTYVVSNGARVFMDSKPLMSSNTTVRLRAYAYYVSLNADTVIIDTNLGPATLVVSNDFARADPRFIRAVIPVTNLQYFAYEVRVSDFETYSFFWTPTNSLVTVKKGSSYQYGSRSVSPYPVELTTTNLISLCDWPSVGQYRVRYVINNAFYTQHGPKLGGARLSLQGDRLDLFITRGSDSIVESSKDNVNWINLAILPWTLGHSVETLQIDLSQPKQFYRAQSW